MTPAIALTRLLVEPALSARLADSEWQGVLTVARAERLDGTLAARLAGLDLPPAVEAVLADVRLDLEHDRRVALWEVERVAAALSALGAPVVLLKGCALAVAGEAAAEGRRIGDVDILVPRHRLADAEAALLAAGWEWAKPDSYDERYYRRWMHELPPMIHATRNGALDVHHTLLPPTAGPTPDPMAVIARARPTPTGLGVPAPTDLLVHAAAHLLADGELDGGLRNLWDIHRLAGAHGSPRFWAELAEHAAGHQLTDPVARALRLSRHLYGTDVPAVALGRRSPIDRLFLRRLLARDGWGRGRSPVTRLGFAVRGHLLRMPPRLLLPHLARKWWRGRVESRFAAWQRRTP